MYVIEVKSKHNNAILLWYFTDNKGKIAYTLSLLSIMHYYQKFNILCFKLS